METVVAPEVVDLTKVPLADLFQPGDPTVLGQLVQRLLTQKKDPVSAFNSAT